MMGGGTASRTRDQIFMSSFLASSGTKFGAKWTHNNATN